MKFKKHVVRWFHVAIVFLLLFSYSWPNLVQAEAKTDSDISTTLHKSSQLKSKQYTKKDWEDVVRDPLVDDPSEIEIAYDDGTAEEALAWSEPGNAWGVKMELPREGESAWVTAGKFYFWPEDWPNPDGTAFQVEIYDANGPDGAPGNKLAGPIDATAKRDGTWTVVDLSSEGFMVNSDFYMVNVQSEPYESTPALAIDESSGSNGHSWRYSAGTWSPSPERFGNSMIRAIVSYEITPPVITSPSDNTYTNEDIITVQGEVAPTTEVTIYNNGEEVATTSETEGGTFTADVVLQPGENILTATATTTSGTTDPSEPVKVVLDQEKPELTIDSPIDGWKTNRMVVEVEGTALDEHLDTVTVNGEETEVNKDGSYSHRILLNNGENMITVVGRDELGNETTKTITVYADFYGPEINNLFPIEDKYLDAGETVRIEMNSKPGLEATFKIYMPLTNSMNWIQSVTELPLMEISEGHYVGFWTATSNLIAEGAQIEVTVKDDYGNETHKFTDGKLFINVPNE